MLIFLIVIVIVIVFIILYCVIMIFQFSSVQLGERYKGFNDRKLPEFPSRFSLFSWNELKVAESRRLELEAYMRALLREADLMAGMLVHKYCALFVRAYN